MTSMTRRALMTTAVVCFGLTAAGSTAGQSRPRRSARIAPDDAGRGGSRQRDTVAGRTRSHHCSSLDGVEGGRRERLRRDRAPTPARHSLSRGVSTTSMATRRRTTNSRRESRCPASGSNPHYHRRLVEAKRRAAANAPRRHSYGALHRRRPDVFARAASRTIPHFGRAWMGVAHCRCRWAVHAVWLDGREAERKMAEPRALWHGAQGAAAAGHLPRHDLAGRAHGRERDCLRCVLLLQNGRSGRRARRVYAAWRHIFPGSMRDIAFAKSTDGGRRFDPLVRVSEDKWELNGCPEDGPTLAVDQAGVIHIAWATVVNDGEPQKALFYATSRDGKTFSPRARLPVPATATPGHPQLTLTPDGGAAIVWDEVVGGVRRVSFTRVSRAGAFEPVRF